MAFLTNLGADLSKPSRRPFCRHCLDWTERRPHLSGIVGASIAIRCFDLGWVIRGRDPPSLTITPKGQEGLRQTFSLSI